MSGKAYNLLKGSFLRICSFFASTFIGIFLMPFILHTLGDSMYGLWILVMTFISYYDLLDIGLNSALARFISASIGVKDYEDTNRVINTTLVIFTLIGAFSGVLTVVIAFAIPHFVRNITMPGLFRTTILLLGLNFAVGFPFRVFPGVLCANVRYDLSTIIELIKIALRTVLIVLSLKYGYGIIALAAITCLMDIMGSVTRYVLVRRLYPYIRVGRQYIAASKLKQLFSYSIYTFIVQLADLLRYNVDNLVITVYLGLTQVTLYSIGSRLISYFIGFISSAMGMFTPVFSEYEARSEFSIITEKFLLITKITGYLSVLVGGLLIIFGRAFIQRWVGVEYLAAYPILVILAVPVILAMMQSTSVQLLFGISKHKFFAATDMAEGLLKLALSLALVRPYGITGVALGTAVPMLAIKLFIQPVYSCRVIDLSVRKYYLGILLPVLAKSTAALAVIWLAVKTFIVPDYAVLLLLIAATLLLFSLAALLTGFSPIERGYFKKVISGRFAHGSAGEGGTV